VAAQEIPHEAQLAAARLDFRVVLADLVQREQWALACRRAHRRHMKSSKCGDSRRNTQRPAKYTAIAVTSATPSPHCNPSRPSSSASRNRVTSQLNGLAAT